VPEGHVRHAELLVLGREPADGDIVVAEEAPGEGAVSIRDGERRVLPEPLAEVPGK